MPRRLSGLVVAALTLALVTACSAATISASPSAGPSATPSSQPSAPVPSVEPSSPPSSPPTPSPVIDRWSSAFSVATAKECSGLVATLDGRQNLHVATTCNFKIQVTDELAFDDWSSTLFGDASHQERDPQLAVDGDRLYLATTRIRLDDGGCGDDGIRNVGVAYRSRTLPDGAWSAPVALGNAGDRLQGLRVVDGTIHITVRNDGDQRVYYERKTNSASQRLVVPGADDTSLRVGSDGRARIAWAAEAGIVVGSVSGSAIDTETISGSKLGRFPRLVLGPSNEAYVMWVLDTANDGGCAGPEPGPRDGTYLSVKAGGSWDTKRFSKSVFATSLTLDLPTQRIRALTSEANGLRLWTRGMSEPTWTSTSFGHSNFTDAIIRVDPTTGRTVIVFVDDSDINVITDLRDH